MSNIKKFDVETYIRLLISEKLGHERDDVERPDMSPQKDNQHKNLDRKPQIQPD